MKQEIKNKFGTIKSFVTASGLNQNQMISYINNRMSDHKKMEFERLIKTKIDEIGPGFVPQNLINETEREMIRLFVVTNFRSIRNFSNIHPEFSLTFISNIITGRKKTKEKRWFRLLSLIEQIEKNDLHLNQN